SMRGPAHRPPIQMSRTMAMAATAERIAITAVRAIPESPTDPACRAPLEARLLKARSARVPVAAPAGRDVPVCGAAAAVGRQLVLLGLVGYPFAALLPPSRRWTARFPRSRARPLSPRRPTLPAAPRVRRARPVAARAISPRPP